MKVLSAGRAVEAAGLTLIPIERMSITVQQEGGHIWLQANKEVAAVVFCEARGIRMVDVSGEVLPLEEWLPQVEGLEAGLQSCRNRA